MNRLSLEQRAVAWRRHHLWRAGLFSLAFAAVTAALSVRVLPTIPAVAITALTSGIVWLVVRRRQPRVTAETIAAHLDRTCPALEESATLWLRPAETLSLVETLQLRRVDAAWAALPERERVGYPETTGLRSASSTAVCGLVALAVAVLVPMRRDAPATASSSPGAAGQTPPPPRPPPTLRAASILITPPAYLGRAPRRLDALDGEAEEGSALTWEFTVAGEVSALGLESTGRGEALASERIAADAFRVRATMGDTRLYQLALTDADGRRRLLPQIHTLKVLRDQPPQLTWLTPATSRSVLDPARETTLPVRLAATDDHGVAEAALVATVAKGSGEGVKFREQRFPLAREGATPNYSRMLDLKALGLEPGDEIYFFCEVIDTRAPQPNRARSETRFVVLRGPAAELSEPGNTMSGVRFVPAYFRSQRQLIIDTEQLIAEKPALTPEKFRARSEEIGVDQKLLRLRYGQFLGEEFEPDASGAPQEARAMGFAARVQGRSRDPGDRSAAIERAAEAQHTHASNTTERDGRPATIEEIRAPFVHVHDNAEVATVFDEQTKAALRAILAEMWRAEGLLRTAQPEAALAPENRALDLLKALQQADRVYVKRVGFEPTPLKIDERRLRGELDAIPKDARNLTAATPAHPDAVALQAALDAITRDRLAALATEVSAAIDARLTRAAREQPEKFLAALELWRRDARRTPDENAALQRALRALVPPRSTAPVATDDAHPALGTRYHDALDASSAAPAR